MKEEDRGRGDGTEEGKEERKEIFSQDPLGADDPRSFIAHSFSAVTSSGDSALSGKQISYPRVRCSRDRRPCARACERAVLSETAELSDLKSNKKSSKGSLRPNEEKFALAFAFYRARASESTRERRGKERTREQERKQERKK